MRIVLVNWAHIWDGASYGGGVNGYCQALGLELVSRGHEVISLCSGMGYTPGQDKDTIGPCELRRHEDWLGIKVFEIFNSPVLAPSLLQFDDPAGEIASPELEAIFARFLTLTQPDVVHFHNIEGLSAGCLSLACQRREQTGKPRVVYSLHNYHTICPQVYLMQGHTTPCFDSAGGRRCAGCIETVDPHQEKLDRAKRFVERFRKAHPLPTPPKRSPSPRQPPQALLPRLKDELKRYLKGEPLVDPVPVPAPTPAPTPAPAPAPVTLPGMAVLGDDDVVRPYARNPEEEQRGQARSLLAKEVNGFVPRPESKAWQPLENTIVPETMTRACETQTQSAAGTTTLPIYGQRRMAMVAALNRCDCVLAVSDFVRRKFESMGVRSDRLCTMPIGSRITEVVAANRELVFAPQPFAENPTRPIRLAFLGYNNHYKGLLVLADALELCTPEVLRRLSISVHAHEGQSMRWRFERLKPRLAELIYQGAYDFSDIPWLLGGKDMVVVPSVWWDNAPQTVFEAFGCGVPVLGARVGGIPDFVTHEHNGLLFRSNDRYDLARTLARLTREPQIIDQLRSHVTPPRSITTHAADMQNLYAQLIHSTRPASEMDAKPVKTSTTCTRSHTEEAGTESTDDARISG